VLLELLPGRDVVRAVPAAFVYGTR
jgi:hypothetical protein